MIPLPIAVGLAVIIICAILFVALGYLEERATTQPTTPRPRTHIDAARKPQPVARPAPVARIPEPVAPNITLDRYRRELTEARHLIDILANQLALRPPTDQIIVFLDVHGAATIDDIANAVHLPPNAVRTRLHELDEQVHTDDGDEWALTIRHDDLDTIRWPHGQRLPLLETSTN